MSSDTKARVSVLENILGVLVEREQLSVCDRLDALFAETFVIQNEIADQRDIVFVRVEELQERPKANLRQKIALLKRAMCGLPREGEVATKVKVPKPKHFNGARSVKDLENFLWDMEQYFKAARVPDQEMVTITSMYLSGDAKL
ncbi:hypothetical protein ACB092_06G169700 [Castanea dentata]